MRTEQVDPRDVTWEVDRPVYRVVFRSAAVSDEWELTEAADVAEVLKWATSQAHGREITVHIVGAVPATAGKGALRLMGPVDPATARRGATAFLGE